MRERCAVYRSLRERERLSRLWDKQIFRYMTVLVVALSLLRYLSVHDRKYQELLFSEVYNIYFHGLQMYNAVKRTLT